MGGSPNQPTRESSFPIAPWGGRRKHLLLLSSRSWCNGGGLLWYCPFAPASILLDSLVLRLLPRGVGIRARRMLRWPTMAGPSPRRGATQQRDQCLTVPVPPCLLQLLLLELLYIAQRLGVFPPPLCVFLQHSPDSCQVPRLHLRLSRGGRARRATNNGKSSSQRLLRAPLEDHLPQRLLLFHWVAKHPDLVVSVLAAGRRGADDCRETAST